MDGIEIVEADPAWPARFEEERTRLGQALAGLDLLAIEHFGSTAIPGLPAKPVIDILIAVPNLGVASATFVPRLEQKGYAFWADNPKADRLFFVKGLPPRAPRRTHHVHVTEPTGEMWERLLFRDYLKAHPKEAQRYADLKRELAGKYPHDREAYTKGKEVYVQQVMDAAQDRESCEKSS